MSSPGEDSHRSLRLGQVRRGQSRESSACPGQPRESSACPGQVRTATGVFGLSRSATGIFGLSRPGQDSHRSLRLVLVRTVTGVRLVKSGQPHESSACPCQDNHGSPACPGQDGHGSPACHRSLRRTITGVFEGGCRILTSFRSLLASIHIIGWTSRDRTLSGDPPSTEPVLTAWLQDQDEFVPPGGPSRVRDLLHAGRHSQQTHYRLVLSEVMAMISAHTVTCELAYSCSMI